MVSLRLFLHLDAVPEVANGFNEFRSLEVGDSFFEALSAS